MTWHADQIEGRPDGVEKEKLLAERRTLVTRIEIMKAAPLRSKTMSAAQGRLEDLTLLAKRIISIDKKLGRVS